MFDVISQRQEFPALNRPRGDRLPIFFDGPGGTQVPGRVIDGMVYYLTACNANHGGLFPTSIESDLILQQAHEAVADLFNAPSLEEVVFGPNMTTLTFHLSRALSRTWKAGDEILVTRLDHDANVTPWVLAAREAGATVRYVDIHPEDCSLDLDDLRRQLSSKTRLIALACASNAVGTVNDVAAVVGWAHEAGAYVFLDAVHFAPHGLIDVQHWDCDFLACSAYKFFGPHVGILWGKRKLLDALPAYKVRPAPESPPYRWMTGTQNHEGIAGVKAAIDYLASIGKRCPSERSPGEARRQQLRDALAAIQNYEAGLARRLLQELAQKPRFKLWGIKNLDQVARRVPTFALTLRDRTPAELATHLAANSIYAWNGNMYAIGLTEALGLEKSGGFLRIGLVHYNTDEEIDALLAALDRF